MYLERLSEVIFSFPEFPERKTFESKQRQAEKYDRDYRGIYHWQGLFCKNNVAKQDVGVDGVTTGLLPGPGFGIFYLSSDDC